MKRRVVAMMATFPPRFAAAARVVSALAPQVDQLIVYVNEAKQTPDFLIGRPKVVAIDGRSVAGDLRDAGKFFTVGSLSDFDFALTVDDDLQYPADYAYRMTEFVKRLGNNCLVGVHGALLRHPFRNLRQSRHSIHFTQSVPRPVPVNLVGTGTLAAPTSLLDRLPFGLLDPGAVDISVARWAKSHDIPIVLVPRPRGWLNPIEIAHGSSLFDEARSPDSLQARLFNDGQPWGANQIDRALSADPHVAATLALELGAEAEGLESSEFPSNHLAREGIRRSLNLDHARPWLALAGLSGSMHIPLGDLVSLPGTDQETLVDAIEGSAIGPCNDSALADIAILHRAIGKTVFRRGLIRSSAFDFERFIDWRTSICPVYSSDPTVHDQEACIALWQRGQEADARNLVDRFSPESPSTEWRLLQGLVYPEKVASTLNSVFCSDHLSPIEFPMGSWSLLQGSASTETPSYESTQEEGGVCIGVVARNADETLRFALRSLANQRYPVAEVVLIDDASSDETISVGFEFQEVLPMTIIKALRPVGPYVGRNIVLAESNEHAAFVGFHDADDWAHPDKLLRQVARLRDTPSSWAVVASHVRGTKEGRLAVENTGAMSGHGPVTALFRRNLFHLVGLFDATMTRGDIEFLHRVQALLGPESVLRTNDLLLLAGASSSSNSLRWQPGDLQQYRARQKAWHRQLGSGTPWTGRQVDHIPVALRASPVPSYEVVGRATIQDAAHSVREHIGEEV